jgi:hypothetical protein
MTPTADVSMDTVMLLARLLGLLSIVASVVIVWTGRVQRRTVPAWQRSEHPVVFWFGALVLVFAGMGMIFLPWFVEIGIFR